MDPERYLKIDELLDAALGMEPVERTSFLDEACASDPQLRREVESLLDACHKAENFIEQPAMELAARSLAEDSNLSFTGKQIARYEIVSLLGAGGMGEVYLANDPQMNRKVALKLLPAQLTQSYDRVARFQRESRAVSALNHPNIITIYEIGQDRGIHFIATEFVEGRTLSASIKSGRMRLDESIDVVIQIASALRAAHEAGILHRDIKPENIMLRPDGYVKLLDFGLAKLSDPQTLSDESNTSFMSVDSTPGMLMGTVKYMSPEQARGLVVDMRTDIFSLGVVFYEMLAGRRPFGGATVSDVIVAILDREPPALSSYVPEASVEIESIINKALRKNLADRYQTAKELLDDLKKLKQDLEIQARIGSGSAEHFLAAVGTQASTEKMAAQSSAPAESPAVSVTRPRTRHTVGREKTHAELHEALASAFAGKGLLMCVQGEPGMGKTTVVEDFLSDLRASGHACIIARGRCSERLAGTEAYLPWLEALDSLLRGADGPGPTSHLGNESIVQMTKRLAPTWYAQAMPLQPDSSMDRLLAERAASQERMKREIVALMEAVSKHRPLVLFFDDLHWADVSTIDLLAYLASKFDSMRVLVIATYRPSDLLLAKHPFLRVKPDLQARGVCREIELEFLSRSEIETYLANEFPEHCFPAELPALIHAKTEGNPLFMADLVRYLRDRQVIAKKQGQWMLAQSLPSIERDLPESVRAMIDRKMAQLIEEDRRLLVAASVQGYEFDSAIVSKALDLDPADVEERLETLERVHRLVRLVSEREFPESVLTQRYRFVHVLYQNALYASLRPTRKTQLSAAVAEALLRCYGQQSATVASELAFLFEAARDWSRASDYYLVAAKNAARVFASQEAGALAERGLEALRLMPDSAEVPAQELRLQAMLGQSLMMAKGYAAPEAERAFIRARDLSLRLDHRVELFRAQFSLGMVYVVQAAHQRAFENGEHCLRLAEGLQNPSMLVQSHWTLGLSRSYLGEFEAAREQFEQTIAIHDAERIDSLVSLYGAVLSRAHLARMLLYLGFADQSQQMMNQAIAKTGGIRHPVALADALTLKAHLLAFQRHAPTTQETAAAIEKHAEEHGLPYYAAIAAMMSGWALAMQSRESEGVTLIREGLAAYLATGTRHQYGYYLALLAEALGEAGRKEEALQALSEALDFASQNKERYFESELYRLRGEALLKTGIVAATDAERCFQQAIDIAKQQQAKSFELRAVISLARLWQKLDKRDDALRMVEGVYGWFTEGFDTPDLKEARALLKELRC
jgi:serine/threonine protein kinase/tetratricopeptide (TPR) repeat protein